MRSHRDHGERPSEVAEPMRTNVAPSRMARLEIAGHSHRQLRQCQARFLAKPIPRLPQQGK